MAELGILAFLGFLIFLVYMIPTGVAMMRGSNSLAGIAVVNFFLGWTLLGWVGALVWAVTGESAPATKRPPKW